MYTFNTKFNGGGLPIPVVLRPVVRTKHLYSQKDHEVSTRLSLKFNSTAHAQMHQLSQSGVVHIHSKIAIGPIIFFIELPYLCRQFRYPQDL